MELLNYDVLAKSGYTGFVQKDAQVKVLQFGEGNFLRAFVDYFFDISNEKAGFDGKVALVQDLPVPSLQTRNGLQSLSTIRKVFTLFISEEARTERRLTLKELFPLLIVVLIPMRKLILTR